MLNFLNANDLYPILDLIRKEIEKYNFDIDRGQVVGQKLEVPNFDEASVKLIRDHPLDKSKVVVTGADLNFIDSGYRVSITLEHSDPKDSTKPGFRLNTVRSTVVTDQGIILFTIVVSLIYDSRGLLDSTSVSKIFGG